MGECVHGRNSLQLKINSGRQIDRTFISAAHHTMHALASGVWPDPPHVEHPNHPILSPRCCPLKLTPTVFILTKNITSNKALAPVNKALLAIILVAFGVTGMSPARAQSAAAKMPTLGDTSDM